MKPSVIKGVPKAGYLPELTFSNGEVRAFDMKRYPNMGLFSEAQKRGNCPLCILNIKILKLLNLMQFGKR
jgi:hypothetical protein